ncbi:hypothetical protein QFC19_004989 [Naganishia cerealis]|uniref:Uncharacterized protein n=1 Tax=Naganishia cerealis TaxID=610337 RepID=A0ACC2VRV0_9TREE|nr:hypothetical protein QFC19_004989 [Naganishia cerealis]
MWLLWRHQEGTILCPLSEGGVSGSSLKLPICDPTVKLICWSHNVRLKKHTEANQILATQLKASKNRSQCILHGDSHGLLLNPKDRSSSDPPFSSLSTTPTPKIAQAVKSKINQPSTAGFTVGLDQHRDLSALNFQLQSQNLMLEREVTRLNTTNFERRKDVRGRKADVEQRRARLKLTSRSSTQESNVPSHQHLLKEKSKLQSYHTVALESGLAAIKDSIAKTARANSQLYSQLVHARRVLVSEAIMIFGVQRADLVASDLPTNGKRKGKGYDGTTGTAEDDEWEIAGLQMPSPRRFTDYSSIHLNAVFEHLIHLLWIITGYLDLILPFTPQWQGFSNSTSMDIPAAEDMASESMVDFASLDQFVMDWKGSGLQYASSALNAFGRAVPKSMALDSKSPSTMPVSQPDRGISFMAEPPDTHRETPKQPVRTPHVGKIFITASSTVPYLSLPIENTSTQEESETMIGQQQFLQKRALLNVSSSRDKWKKRQWKREAQSKAQGDCESVVDRQGELGEAATAVRDKHKEKEDHLNLAYTMLIMDVIYIAQSQGVLWVEEILDNTRDGDDDGCLEDAIRSLLVNPLRLLDDLRWSPGLGR